jgi:hypothetical protein
VTESTRGQNQSSTSSAIDTQFESLEAEHALFEGRVQGLIALIAPDEKPPRGLAGLLDWRFQGAISQGLAHGFLTGEAGECTYLPLTRAGQTYHVILVGAGSSSRGTIPADSLKSLKKNLGSLKLQRLGISRADWDAASDDFFSKNLKGTGLCILK